MSRVFAGFAAFALLLMIALPGPANAAERRADGLRVKDAAMTDVSSQWRARRAVYRGGYWRRGYWRGAAWRRAAWGPRWGYGYGWRARYAGWGYPYAYPYAYPYYWRPRPVIAVSFGPAWGWGPRWGWGGRRWWW
jgi:hypothetical protein